jgi:hypothetical protein
VLSGEKLILIELWVIFDEYPKEFNTRFVLALDEHAEPSPIKISLLSNM